MRKILLFAAAIVIVNLFPGCQKEEYQIKMTANIDSMAFSSTGANVILMHDSTQAGNDVLIATSDNYTPGTAVRPVILLNIPERVGTFAIGKEANANVTTANTNPIGVGAISGEVVVLNKENGQLHGSFSFKLGNGMSVTGGQFVAKVP